MRPETGTEGHCALVHGVERHQQKLDDPDASADLDVRTRVHTPAQAAKLLTVPESWLRRQAGQRRIPCTFLGRHLRFSNSDLDAIIAIGARPANSSRRRHIRTQRTDTRSTFHNQ
jgi:excisionase family DNA binding protein